MKSINVRIYGQKGSAIMFNNPRTVNPLDEYTKKISAITSKKKKTDEDHEEIQRLKFLASLYYNSSTKNYYIDGDMIFASIRDAAKEYKKGEEVKRSLFVVENQCKLEFEGSDLSPEKLYKYKNGRYVDTRNVKLQGKAAITATRALIFTDDSDKCPWQTECTIIYDESRLNDEEVLNFLTQAGLRYHLGTYKRKFGHFTFEVIK